MAVFAATQKFRRFIDRRHCVVFTDHKPIIASFRKTADLSPRQSRQFSFLSDFIDDIFHLSGDSNVVADCFSRPEVEEVSTYQPKFISAVTCDLFDLQSIDKTQTSEFKNEMNNIYSRGTKLIEIPPNTTILCDNNIIPRSIVPKDMRKRLFLNFHIQIGKEPTILIMHVSLGLICPRTSKNGARNASNARRANSQDIQSHRYHQLKGSLLDLNICIWTQLDHYLRCLIALTGIFYLSSIVLPIGLKPFQ